MNNKRNTNNDELDQLCVLVKALVAEKAFDYCIDLICEAMGKNPHAPHPHNLLGIVLEKQGDHLKAMKHFRAAWALDPSYAPASHNLSTYGTFFTSGKCAFDENDVPSIPLADVEIIYDKRGIGHVESKTKIEYDQNGIGHAVRR